MVAVSLIERGHERFVHADGFEPGSDRLCDPNRLASMLDGAANRDSLPPVTKLPGGSRIRSYARHPLFGHDRQPVGTLWVYDTRPRRFDGEQVDMLRQLAIGIQREMEGSDDLKRAATVQRRLLPPAVGRFPGVVVRGLSLPAFSVSGDFFDFYRVRDGLVLTLADVMGAGLGAAVLGAGVRTGLRVAALALELAGRTAGPREGLELVAGQLHDDLDRAGSFVTLFHAVLNPATGILRYVDAGHGLAAVFREDGSTQLIGGADLPLGIARTAAYQIREVHVHPGDAVVIASDGILNLPGESGDLAIGELAVSLDPDEICDLVKRKVRGYWPGDDVTVLALRRNPAA